jgi:hypothetical protein
VEFDRIYENKSGSLYACGFGKYTGHGNAEAVVKVPAFIPSLNEKAIVHIACAESHILALTLRLYFRMKDLIFHREDSVCLGRRSLWKVRSW